MEINNNIDTLDEEELQANLEKHNEYIASLEVDELYERIIKAYESTDVILEGLSLVTAVNEGLGITIAGLLKLRVALEETLVWFDNNLIKDESDEL